MANLTFSVVGITTLNGNDKVRFANDLVRRIKIFSKDCSRVDLIDLPSEMSKVDALKYLQSHPDFQSAADQATITDSMSDKVKAKKKDEPKAEKVAKPSLDAIKARGKKVTKEVTVDSIMSIFTSPTDVDLHNVDPA